MTKSGVISAIILALLLSVRATTADEPSVSTESVVMPVELFFKEMQLLARRVPVGNSKLEQEDSLKALREKIHAQFDGVVLEYDTRITSVDWRNNLATIKSLSPIRSYKRSARLPFTITKTLPLVVPLSREATASLNKRKPLNFSGKLLFLDEKFGSVGRPPKSQTLFGIQNSSYKGVYSIGTFITTDYSVSIGDNEIFAHHPDQEIE